ncbi:MAG: glycine betaine/L-proline ABC transporter substrate-binding protein ProX [Phormidesmis sp.]
MKKSLQEHTVKEHTVKDITRSYNALPFKENSSLLLKQGTKAGFQIGLSVSLLSCLSLLIGCQQDPITAAQRPLVRPAYGTLEELFQTEIVSIGLETLGYTVLSGSEIEYDTLHEAIAKGYVDYTTVHWNPLHQKFLDDNGGNTNMVSAGTLVKDAIQGYSIDRATAQQYAITNLEQLKDPQIAALFDTDGNNKANLVGCPPGWGCREVIEHHLDVYGLRDTVDHDNNNYFGLIDRVIADQTAGNPVLYYTWTPMWVSNILTPGDQVEWLEVPYTSLPSAYADDTSTTVNGKNLGFAVNQIEILANKEFLINNPIAKSFFEAVEIPIEAINIQNQKMRAGQNTPVAVRKHAEAWIEENQALFDSWIAASQTDQ